MTFIMKMKHTSRLNSFTFNSDCISVVCSCLSLRLEIAECWALWYS